MRFIAAVGACALAGCASDKTNFEAGPDPAVTSATSTTSSGTGGGSKSGSRLKQQFYLGADGSRIDSGFIDSQLGVPCFPTLAADGKIRCLPFDSTASNSYLDSGCVTEAVLVAKGCAAPKYARRSNAASACGGAAFGIYNVSPKVQPASMLFALSGGKCVAGGDLSASHEAYPLGVQISATTFVEMTQGTE